MTDTTFEPFVRNAWYIAAWPEELEDGVVARTIMNQPLALFRDAGGKAAALEDRCCHRGAPLTSGRITSEGIECGYHGLIFDGGGKCVRVPGQDNVPKNAWVRSYPVVEKNQFIWIWMGDPAKADESLIIDYPFHDQADVWPHRRAMFQIKANYMMMMDNLMDLTHLGYVHSKTIGGNPNVHVSAELTAEPTDRGCRLVRWMLDSPPPPTYVKAVGFKGHVDRCQDFEYVAPASVIQYTGAIDVGKNAKEVIRDEKGLHFRLFHHATPETKTSFHYFFSVANGYRQDEPEATQQLFDETYPTFLEDKEIMELQQQRLELDPTRELVNIKADTALFLARKRLHEMLAAEQAQMAAAAE